MLLAKQFSVVRNVIPPERISSPATINTRRLHHVPVDALSCLSVQSGAKPKFLINAGKKLLMIGKDRILYQVEHFLIDRKTCLRY